MSSDSQPIPSTTGQIDVLLVNDWLIFDCPGCDQTIKIDRDNASFEIQCPSCALGFAPLLRTADAPDGSERLHSKTSAPESAPLADELPQEGKISLEIRLSPARIPSATGNRSSRVGPSRPPSGTVPESQRRRPTTPNPAASNLPVRSEDGLENRRLTVTPLHPPSKTDETFSSVIEEGGGQYKRIRVRTRKKRANEKQKALRFYLLAGLASILLIAGAIYLAALASLRSDKAEKEESRAQTVASPVQPQGPVITDWKVLIQSMIEAEEWEEFLDIVRKPNRVRKRMAAFYADGNLYHDILDATLESETITKDLPSGFRRGRLQLSGKSMVFYLENTATHGFRLDWESFVGAGTMLWEDFRNERTTTPQRMRVIASLSDYYEGLFEKNRYQSIRLEDATGAHTLYSFLRRSSPTDRDFLERLIGSDLTWSGSNKLQVVLDLRYPADATNNVQVEIVEYISDRWLIP